MTQVTIERELLERADSEIRHVLGSTIEPWQRKALESAIDAIRAALQAAPAQVKAKHEQARLGMRDGLSIALSVVELYGMKGDVTHKVIAKLRDEIQISAQVSNAVFPPLPHSVLRCGQTVVYDALQMHQYAMRFAAT